MVGVEVRLLLGLEEPLSTLQEGDFGNCGDSEKVGGVGMDIVALCEASCALEKDSPPGERTDGLVLVEAVDMTGMPTGDVGVWTNAGNG